MMSLRDSLRGTGVALATPFNDKYEVDFEAWGKLLDFVMHGGVEYLVVLGTTGETPTLETQEKIDLLQYTYDKVGKTLPIVVGIGGNNTKAIVNDLQTYPLDNAIAVLSASPNYN